MKSTMTLLALAAVSSAASADISYVQRIDVEGGGAMSMMSATGTVLTQIAGDRSRSESDMGMQSALASAMDQNQVNVIRLDKALSWTLFPRERRYTEQPFSELRAQLAKLDSQRAQMSGGSGGILPVSEESCRWSEPQLAVEKGGREKVAGIRTRRHTLRLGQSCTDPDSGQTCDLTWILDTWLAKKVPAQAEVESFHRRYAEAIGAGELMRHAQGHGQVLMAMFDDNWEELADELADLNGYPLKSVMELAIGGEQCRTASGSPIALDEVWSNAGTAAYNAAVDQAGVEAGREAGRAMGDSIAGSIGGAAVGAAAGELVGGLTGLFKKKQKPKEETEPARAAADSAQVTVFRISTEVTDWSEVQIPADRFEKPVGWKPK